MDTKHPKRCECAPCVARRFDSWLEGFEAFEAKNHIRPTNPDQTVFVKKYTVRPHFRKNPHHMQGDPILRERRVALHGIHDKGARSQKSPPSRNGKAWPRETEVTQWR